jgi:hypothetical protein
MRERQKNGGPPLLHPKDAAVALCGDKKWTSWNLWMAAS